MKIFFCNFSKSLLVSAANNLLCWPVHNAETLVEVYLNNQRFYLFHASTYFHERTSLLRIRIFFKQTRLYTILIQFYTLQFLSYLNTNPTSFFSFLLLGFIWLHGIFEGHADIAGRQSEPVEKKYSLNVCRWKPRKLDEVFFSRRWLRRSWDVTSCVW